VRKSDLKYCQQVYFIKGNRLLTGSFLRWDYNSWLGTYAQVVYDGGKYVKVRKREIAPVEPPVGDREGG
jgi:hypothetical protein